MNQLAAAVLAGALVGAAVAAALLVPWITRLQIALEQERTRRGSMGREGCVGWQEFRFTDGERAPDEAPSRSRSRRRSRGWE